MGESISLKEGNKAALTTYGLAHGIIIAWILLGLPLTYIGLTEVAKAEWPKAGVALVVSLFITLLNRQVGSNFKAILVFWRARHPLPGNFAFSELAPQDSRIDLNRLKQAVGGIFPIKPEEQNKAWYRLYQQQKNNPSILNSHKDYLLFRDLTWITTILAVVCPLTMYFTHHGIAAIWYFTSCIVLYGLCRRAAQASAQSFVITVMASAAAEQNLQTGSVLEV